MFLEIFISLDCGIANFKEINTYRKRRELEAKAKELCKTFIKELNLEMKLTDVECYFDKSKIVFYYTAEGRIDFRELVKQFAKFMRMRIEIRQIGVRNETALLSGIGVCGKEFCCAQYLRNFMPLSIKMAKDQGLILDPNKVSGPCGRLFCCLAYEEPVYREFLSKLPQIGSRISFQDQTFKVIKYNIFYESVTLEGEDKNLYTIPIFYFKNYVLLEEEEGEGWTN